MNVLRLSGIKQKCYLFNSCAGGVEDGTIGQENVQDIIFHDFVRSVRSVHAYVLDSLQCIATIHYV